MNNLINDIAEHCDFYVGNEHHDKLHEEKQRLWTEKFLELVVNECAEVAGCNGHVSGFALGDLMKNHFGIDS